LPIEIARDALVLLVGPAGSGKSTFAARHFPGSAVLSSDGFRELLRGDPADQAASEVAFRLLHAAADERLERGHLTVVDATNVAYDAREPLLALARRHERPALAIVFSLSLAECLAWNAKRQGRVVPERVIRRQHRLFSRAAPHLASEGLHVVELVGPSAVAAARVIVVSR